MRLEVNSKWGELFDELKLRSPQHSCDVAGANASLNRFADVQPFDKTRIKLKRTILHDGVDYINANSVTVPKATRHYILTQGPLKETFSHFWLMVWEQKSNVIVMLNRCADITDKSEPYWPHEEQSTKTYDDVQISVTLASVENKKHYIERKFIITDDKTRSKREVIQFQYTGWPDSDEPESPSSFLRLLAAVRRSGGLDKMDEPTVIHCAAGIGRSGTFCLIDSVLSMIENQGSTEGIDIANVLIEMRDYRKGLIQSPIQLRFAFTTIVYGVKLLEKANKLHPHISYQTNDNVDNGDTNNRNDSSESNHTINMKSRRSKKNKKSNNLNSLNIFKKHMLVDAIEDIDSDEADRNFYEVMRPWPDMKKPRNDHNYDTLAHSASNNSHNNPTSSNHEATTKEESLNFAINHLLNSNSIAINNAGGGNNLDSKNSVLIRRLEREQRNQRLEQKTKEIKARMKEEDAKRELKAKRLVTLKYSAVVGVVAVVCLYLYQNVISSA